MSPSLLPLALLAWASLRLPVQVRVQFTPHQPPLGPHNGNNANFHPPGPFPPSPPSCEDATSTVTVTASSVEIVTVTSSTLSPPASNTGVEVEVVTVTVTEAGLRGPPMVSQPVEIQKVQTVTVTQPLPHQQPQSGWEPWGHGTPDHGEDPAWGPERGPLVQTVTVTEPAADGLASAPTSTMVSVSIVTVTRSASIPNHPHGNGWPRPDGWRHSVPVSYPKLSVSASAEGPDLVMVTVTLP